VAWSRWPREGRWFLCLREGKDRRCLAWIESRDEEVPSDLFLSAVWGAASPWFWQCEGGHREIEEQLRGRRMEEWKRGKTVRWREAEGKSLWGAL